MFRSRAVRVRRVTSETGRRRALQVLGAIYQNEKGWVADARAVFPVEELSDEMVSWFIAFVGRDPAGVIRVDYAPPLDVYRTYSLQVLPGMPDVEEFLRTNRVAEIGRFAVTTEYRRMVRVASALIRAATRDTVRRGYTHYVTDVFEGEQHSPYNFHTRVLGFQVVASHETGELNCSRRRITLVLSLREAYNRLREQRRSFFRFLTRGWDEALHRQLAS